MHLRKLLFTSAVFGGSLSAVLLGGQLLAPPAFARQIVMKGAIQLVPAQPVAPVKKDDKANTSVDPVELDKKSLEAAGLKADDTAGLIAYLKSRTLNEADMSKIQALIKKMNGEAKFDDRLAAQEEIIQIGGQAVAPLRLVIKDDKQDPEIIYRAKDCLRRMEKERGLGLDATLAVIRTLGRSKDPQAAPTLIGFLPLADSTLLVEAIQSSLRDTAGTDGKPSPVLTAALADENALRRRVAALALIGVGTADTRIRFKEVHPKLVEIAKTDKDAGVRFAVARALLAESREKEAVPVLIDLMPDMTRGQSWQAEELLMQLAGKDAPKERCVHARDRSSPDRELSTNKKKRETTRDAWKKWWDGAKDKTDVAKADLQQTIQGHFVMVTQGWAGNGQAVNMTEYGTDDKERNRLAFQATNGVTDLVMTDAGTVFTIDYTAAVSVRDLTGKVTTTWAIPVEKNNRNVQPKGLQLRDNGNLMVVHMSGVVEFDKAGKEAFKYTRPELNKNPQMDVIGATRMKNGHLVLNLNSNKLLTVDEKGKEVEGRKPVQIGSMNQNQKSLIQQSGEDRVVVVEQQSIMEYDLKAGKADGVKIQGVYAMSVQKLPNGNILYATNNEYPYRVIEKTAAGEEVWSMTIRDPNNQQLVKGMVR